MVRRGTTQGTVLSPLLYNLAVNPLLRGLEYSGNDAIANADDIVIAESGIYPQTLSDKFNLALSIVLDWSRDFGLSINPAKTETVLYSDLLPSYYMWTHVESLCKYLINDPKLN